MPIVQVSEEHYQAMVKKSDELLGKLYMHHPQTVEHSQRVSILTQGFLKHYCWGREDITMITMAASLHDIGKLRVDADLLNKGSAISILEQIQLDAHAAHTESILREEGIFPEEFIQIAASHHECWDGSGYPKKLKGEMAPMGGRLLHLIDAYVAMQEERPDRIARTKEQTIDYLKNHGELFDPIFLSQFLAYIRQAA